ncbi:glutamate/gamma-aminobutyrate family transporter YjeM [Liquorilactobacillus satsumensis]|uniref:Signal peptide protein, YSIRK family n=1 Tax=Liquorilactobacillus satsumensis DSM 16230 = JCM 12392 TaxID=1423801 RepID=A0A0R1V055_9LACO|nr:signal peptide protein, YSIRK family [Liquorilactobacillus satsumensis DSM 16230 = JCM 12392]MCC7666302.1 glutamate/gamma-aminobutyrate family transporter YjeM [Liquorilactobacillus satsumensis]MCP9358407.1 glutamate/gamma-aminobutyrate family transporter YjeM [Liquorilactobacillus satsumensis]MCP9372361.1 glutamate/gamma-aminobutyrate family transporter YjeM [Liquorilactobacillus satsumensis]
MLEVNDLQKSTTLSPKTVTFLSVMLMIFTSTFAFDNTSIAYYTMGYAGIVWYILAALLFFVPSSLMFAEFGAAFHNEPGGVYAWLENSLGIKWAFIGGFVWIASWIILIVSTVSKIWIMLSTTLSGADQTSTWHFGNLDSTTTLGLISILFFCFVTFISTKGIEKIVHLASIGGLAAVAITLFFFAASLFVLCLNHFQLAEPISLPKSLLVSPRKSYQSVSQTVSFVIFAVYAFAGIEALGGVSDRMKNAKRNFAFAMALGAILITVIYALFIFMWGASANWTKTFTASSVNLGNTTYVLMSNLGRTMALSLGLKSAAPAFSFWCARFAALMMLLSYCGSFFVIAFMPIKSFILGTPKKLWPAFLTKLNHFQMPANAMWAQALLVSILLALTSFGGKSAVSFYNVLTLMDNISSTLPYLFLVTAFAFFKAKYSFNETEIVFFKHQWSTLIVVCLTDALLLVGVGATVISAVSAHQYWDLFLEIIGPLLFGLIGYTLYRLYRTKVKHSQA